MFSHIKTSKENKEVVTLLTNKLNLGAENVIARIALAYSLAQDKKLKLMDLKDSGGKEYSKSVLFGDNYNSYIGMICNFYQINNIDKNFPKYVKLHLDDGLNRLQHDKDEYNSGFEFILKLVNQKI
jgi:DNA sulfur modification protein DndE